MVKLLRKEAYLWERQELECKSSGESKHALIKNFRLWNRESNIRWQAQNRWNASPGHASQHERHWIYWLQQSSLVAISPSLCQREVLVITCLKKAKSHGRMMLTINTAAGSQKSKDEKTRDHFWVNWYWPSWDSFYTYPGNPIKISQRTEWCLNFCAVETSRINQDVFWDIMNHVGWYNDRLARTEYL